jgi:hypothetical protein
MNDGDVSGTHGQADVWVIKIDASGNLLWSKLFGGSGNDAAFGSQAASANMSPDPPAGGSGLFLCRVTRSSGKNARLLAKMTRLFNEVDVLNDYY